MGCLGGAAGLTEAGVRCAAVRPGLSLFVRRLPVLFAAWVIAISGAGVALVVMGRFDAPEGIGIAIALIPLAIPVLPLMWLHPVWYGEDFTIRRAATAGLWALVTFIPSVLACAALGEAFGVP